MIRKLIYKMRKRRFCKLNRWFCPDCIYHDFVFEGATFRGNRCRYPKYREKGRIKLYIKAQDRPIICPRCGRTFAESEGRDE